MGDYALAIFLDVEEEELRHRLLERGKEGNRADDNEATIEARLEMFKETVQPCLDHLQKSEKLTIVSGEENDILSRVNDLMDKLDAGMQLAQESA